MSFLYDEVKDMLLIIIIISLLLFGNQTFMRQKVSLAASHSLKERTKDYCGRNSTTTHPTFDKSEKNIPSTVSADQSSEALENVTSGCVNSLCTATSDIQNRDLFQQSQNTKKTNPTFLCKDCHEHSNLIDGVVDTESTTCLKRSGCEEDTNVDRYRLRGCPQMCNAEESVDVLSKGNENVSSSGVLRYALHLRFLCTSKTSSKSIQRCKSDPFCTPQMDGVDAEDDRRFYLYNDLRVVFPQRQSDSDEGKVMLLL